jgi:hypothetical protein
LFTTDPRAVNHILTHSDEFGKSQELKGVIELLGEGAYSVVVFILLHVDLFHPQGFLFAEGERHRKQVSLESLEQIVVLGLPPSPEASHNGMPLNPVALTLIY